MTLLQRLHDGANRLTKDSLSKLNLPALSVYNLGSYALNRLTSKKDFKHIDYNIAYGLKARQRLDLYHCARPRKGAPLLLFVHGGAWQSGDKKDYLFLAESFCSEGFNVAILNYHLAPTHIFPTYVNDLATALSFLQKQSAQLNIACEQIVLMGHSAGAFNIMSMLYPPQLENASEHAALLKNVKAVFGLAGPYHFEYVGDPLAQDAFDLSVPSNQVMPIHFVTPNPIQHYLLIAQNDVTVAAYNSTDLQHALLQQGNHSHIAVIPRTGHVAILASLASLFSPYFATKRTIMQFMHEALSTQH